MKMARLVSLYTMQWGDVSLEELCKKAKVFGYDGLEVALPVHLDISHTDDAYYQGVLALLKKYDLKLVALASHLVGQCICDPIDFRHKAILPKRLWGDGDPEGVRQRAAQEMIRTAQITKQMGCTTVVSFTGSPIWSYLYSFPPVPVDFIDKGYEEFGRRMKPILDEFQKIGVRFALEVHPTEVAFDIVTARRALEAVDNHPAFGFNFDPSHLGYQGVDYVGFLYEFADRIFHVHMKDVYWSDAPKQAGVYGGYATFGDPRRFWNFRSVGRGRINFEEIIRALNDINYQGPLSVEWEDSAMDREHGSRESCAYVKKLDFRPSHQAFDANFEVKE